MCPSQQSQDSYTASQSETLTLRVEDMTCGHCAGKIKKAIEVVLPGVEVLANPDSKLVLIKGAAEASKLKALITAAGFTPSDAPNHA